MSHRPPTCVIENVKPLVECGKFPIKRAIGEDVTVTADVFKEGHDELSAVLKWRKRGDAKWHESPMISVDPYNRDRWKGVFSVSENAVHEFTIEAWGEYFFSWQHEFHTKFAAGLTDLKSETLEGASFVDVCAGLARAAAQTADADRLTALADELRRSTPAEVDALAHTAELEGLMTAYSDRRESTEFILTHPPVDALVERADPPLNSAAAALPPGKTAASAPESDGKIAKKQKPGPVPPSLVPRLAPKPSPNVILPPAFPLVHVDRPRALFSQWYEFFPRSAEGRGDKGSTFRDCLPRVDDARAMGFDVIYFPPIHPVGVTARKGKNNSVSCQPGEPGVPYAIGNRHQNCPNGGGHKDVAPELGTLEDFDWLVAECAKRDLEIALDFAINCSPDHPYVQAHPDWFYQRPDGTIKYAENPPKKYQDVYPMNFHNADWRAMWEELTSVIEFWCEHGVRIFRVDNPHTKPVAFWEYLIGRVQRRFPDALFLSEAFTRPRMMKALAKAGFTHSYSYFTWRNTKRGLIEYFEELTQTECAEYMRPNLWPNTPDILPSVLQFGGRPAFVIRAVLAATLSPVYGIYSGFELCENAGLEKKPWDAPGDVRQFLHLCDTDYKLLAREEYLDSEKYQWKERDWNAPGNIKGIITQLNRIRRENRALQELRNLRFHAADNDLILCYSKGTPARENLIIIVVSLDPFHMQEAFINVPIEGFGIIEGQTYQVHDLLNGERYVWNSARNYIRLDPERPAHVFRLRRKSHVENGREFYS